METQEDRQWEVIWWLLLCWLSFSASGEEGEQQRLRGRY